MSRVLLRSVTALVAAVAAVLAGWRVLAPAEVLAAASAPYPAAVDRPPGVTGDTNLAPLIVDDRIRVYAAKRQVRADGPVDARTVMTPRWSFRRWPEQLSGVVATGRTVISRWSDGALVAIDAGSGTIAWRAGGPPAPGFPGGRTAAAAVWQPRGLYVGSGAVVVTGGGKLTAYETSNGTRRWTTPVPATCSTGFTTGGGQFVCPAGEAFDLATGRPAASFPAGPHVPLGCQVAASNCTAVREAAGRGWFVDRPVPLRVPLLDRPDSTVAAGLVLYREGERLRMAEPDGRQLRGYLGEAQVLGAAGRWVVLLTPQRRLDLLDPRTGATRGYFHLRKPTELTAEWDPGRWQLTGRHLAVERLALDRPADPDAPGYFWTTSPVLIAAI